jgi:hypothetical protein
MSVLRRKERWLVCAAVRFFRTMLSIKVRVVSELLAPAILHRASPGTCQGEGSRYMLMAQSSACFNYPSMVLCVLDVRTLLQQELSPVL